MTRYTYEIAERDDRVDFTVKRGTDVVASSIIMLGRNDFESYSVPQPYQGRGLSYVLTYLMLLYCKDNGSLPPTVSNAHGVLMRTLPDSKFPLEGAVRITKGGKEQAGSYRCANIQQSIDVVKKKLIQKGIISDGLRFTGPYRWKQL